MRILGVLFEVIEVDITNSLLPSDFVLCRNTCCPSEWNSRVANSDIGQKSHAELDVDSESVQCCQAEADLLERHKSVDQLAERPLAKVSSWLPLLDAGG